MLADTNSTLAWATLALACVTAAMAAATGMAARYTARAARAAERDVAQGQDLLRLSQQQVDAAQAQTEAAIAASVADFRPLIVPATGLQKPDQPHFRFRAFNHVSAVVAVPPVGQWWREDASRVWLVIAVRNIGRGPAIFSSESSDVLLTTMYGSRVAGWLTSLIVGPGDLAYAAFEQDASTLDGTSFAHMVDFVEKGGTPQVFTVEVALWYADLRGSRSVSRVTFQVEPRGELDQRRVQLENDD